MAKLKLLLTARDPSAALAFKHLMWAVIKDERFQVVIVAQTPGFEILNSEFSDFPQLIRHFRAQETASELINQAKCLLKEIAPDMVLTGVSGPDVGIDEAMSTALEGSSIGSYQYQGYWGDLNLQLLGRAKTIFVLDDYAKQVTALRTKAKTIAVGSMKHQDYKHLNIEHMRKAQRSKLGLSSESSLVGFFGQPLQTIKAYKKTIKKYADACEKLPSNTVLLYRPHPKEPEKIRHWVIECLNSATKQFILDSEDIIENSLVACDVVVSVFSTCCYDVQQLINAGKKPFSVPVYLMYDKEINAWYEQYTQCKNIPQTHGGMALVINDSNLLGSVLRNAQMLAAKEQCFKAIKTQFISPADAARTILTGIYQDWQGVTLDTKTE